MKLFFFLAVLAPLAIAVALPALCDFALWVRGLGKRSEMPQGNPRPARLIFLVPSHNEEVLIARTVRSLLDQDYPADRRRVMVLADNCDDRTAEYGRKAGATVLERSSDALRGKHHAIEWALREVASEEYDAVVIIDADTIVAPDYASQISRWPDLTRRALQTYDDLSNEQTNALTRLAGLLTRIRYDIVLPLKARAGLSVPMTGDGIVLGSELLRKYPWHIRSITEGWELYAHLSIAGERIGYEPRARLYAQETQSLDQSQSQRERWTAGRLAVLRMYWKALMADTRSKPLQRLDIVAELMSMGPVVRAVAGLAGAGVTALSHPPGAIILGALYLTGIVQPAWYTWIVLWKHPEPWSTVRAMAYLPVYAVWRTFLAARVAVGHRAMGSWTRTARKHEGVVQD